MNYSKYQQAVFDWVELAGGMLPDSRFANVNAVAGSGKTFTATESVRFMNPTQRRLLACFNVTIKNALKEKLGFQRNLYINNYNSEGWKVVCNNLGKKPLLTEEKSVRALRYKAMAGANGDEDWKLYSSIKGSVKRLIGMFKANCCFDTRMAELKLPDILERHDIKWNRAHDELLFKTFDSVIKDIGTFDFDDQLFMPLKMDMNLPIYDGIMIDEFQDTNLMQSQFLDRCLSSYGWMATLGDPDQAIYGFREATPDAIGRWIEEKKAVTLPLSICYRCPIAVIEEAKLIVPRIEAAPGAKQGVVDHVTYANFMEMITPDCYVLCRVTEDLVSFVLECLRKGIAATVIGREIGDTLVDLIQEVSPVDSTIKSFSPLLHEYETRKVKYFTDTEQESKIAVLRDKISAILAIAEDCEYTSCIVKRINEIFSELKDNPRGIKAMTVHKAKGLQSPLVFILNPDTLEDDWNVKRPWQVGEQRRLRYVAITRSENELFTVENKPGRR